MGLTAWLLLPGLALALLAAHLFHAGLGILAVVPLLLLVLLGIRRPWAARVVQVVLVVATIEWLLTALTLARLRAGHDQPYLRLLIILGSVAVFTAIAAAVIQRRSLRAWFRLDAPPVAPSAAVRD